eukprot:753344-Hanusia_phi.AAC.1
MMWLHWITDRTGCRVGDITSDDSANRDPGPDNRRELRTKGDSDRNNIKALIRSSLIRSLSDHRRGPAASVTADRTRPVAGWIGTAPCQGRGGLEFVRQF